MHTAPPQDTRPAVAELLEGLHKVSGHQRVLLRLNAFLADEDGGFQQLVEILRLDPGLSARVISAANTAYFRGGLLAGSVDEAVVRIGVMEVSRLLLGSIAFELTSGRLPSYGLAPGDLWNRSLVCALAMHALGQEARRSTDVCHTIGLMHGLGMIVIDRWITRTRPRQLAPLGDPEAPGLSERERELVGFTSSELGARLLESWRFPENIVNAVGFQNAPLAAGRFSRLACLLSLARWLGRTVLVGRDLTQLPDPPSAGILEGAGLGQEAVAGLLEPVRREFFSQKAALGVF